MLQQLRADRMEHVRTETCIDCARDIERREHLANPGAEPSM